MVSVGGYWSMDFQTMTWKDTIGFMLVILAVAVVFYMVTVCVFIPFL